MVIDIWLYSSRSAVHFHQAADLKRFQASQAQELWRSVEEMICLPLCIIQFQCIFLEAAADCTEWQNFYMVLFCTCGYSDSGSLLVFLFNCLRAQRSHLSKCGFKSCPLPNEVSADPWPTTYPVMKRLSVSNVLFSIFMIQNTSPEALRTC